MARLIGPPFELILKQLGISLSSREFERFVSIYRRRYWELAPAMSPPYEGVPELLEELSAIKKRVPGFAVGVVTNKRTEVAEHILNHVGLTPYLDFIQGFDDGLRPKPAPDLILRAVERAEVSPRGLLMVGDTAGDLLAAQAVGARSCLATYGYGADAVPPSLTPDLRIDHPSQLTAWLRAHSAC